MSAEGGPVESIRITHVLECLADSSKIRVMAEISCDITEAMPYLAALLPQAGYNHSAALMTLMREGRLITVYPRMVTVAKALDEDDAQDVLEWLRGRINEAYARRGELVPCLERRRSPRLLDIYRLLPRDNCRLCGEATCMALAARLVSGDARVQDCTRMTEAEFARNRELLAEWLGSET